MRLLRLVTQNVFQDADTRPAIKRGRVNNDAALRTISDVCSGVSYVGMIPVDASHCYFALDDMQEYRRIVDLRDFGGEGKGIEWRQCMGHKGFSKKAIAYPLEVNDSRPL